MFKLNVGAVVVAAVVFPARRFRKPLVAVVEHMPKKPTFWLRRARFIRSTFRQVGAVAARARPARMDRQRRSLEITGR
jgi:hypothetical protein